MENENIVYPIAGFWRRLLASIIDWIILGAIGYAIGIPLEAHFVKMGNLAGVIGFGIAGIYFTILNSNLAKGQTFGKRLLGICVVNKNGEHINIIYSFLRYFILGLPTLVQSTAQPDSTFSYLGFMLAFISIALFLSTTYLLIFNRNTRQLPHDYIAGTFVVRAGSQPNELRPVWFVHYIFVLIFIIISMIGVGIGNKLAKSDDFKGLMKVRDVLIAQPDINNASVSSGFSFLKHINKDNQFNQFQYLSARVFLNENKINDAGYAKKIAVTIFHHYPESKQQAQIFVTLSFGFNLGIIQKWNNQTYTFKPNELHE